MSEYTLNFLQTNTQRQGLVQPFPWACPICKSRPHLWLFHEVCGFRPARLSGSLKDYLRHHVYDEQSDHQKLNRALPTDHVCWIDPEIFQEIKSMRKDWRDPVVMWSIIYNKFAGIIDVEGQVTINSDPYFTPAWLQQVFNGDVLSRVRQATFANPHFLQETREYMDRTQNEEEVAARRIADLREFYTTMTRVWEQQTEHQIRAIESAAAQQRFQNGQAWMESLSYWRNQPIPNQSQDLQGITDATSDTSTVHDSVENVSTYSNSGMPLPSPNPGITLDNIPRTTYDITYSELLHRIDIDESQFAMHYPQDDSLTNSPSPT